MMLFVVIDVMKMLVRNGDMFVVLMLNSDRYGVVNDIVMLSISVVVDSGMKCVIFVRCVKCNSSGCNDCIVLVWFDLGGDVDCVEVVIVEDECGIGWCG